MQPTTQTYDESTPYFLFVSDKYTLATPRGSAASNRTIDMSFSDFAADIELQQKLNLGSWIVAHSSGRDGVAAFISAFTTDAQKSKIKYDYMQRDGLVRLLVTDEELWAQVNQR